jgi:hypothetical protein
MMLSGKYDDIQFSMWKTLSNFRNFRVVDESINDIIVVDTFNRYRDTRLRYSYFSGSRLVQRVIEDVCYETFKLTL